MSVMLQDMLMTYKLGWKTSYYQNTYDYKTDPSDIEDEKPQAQPLAQPEELNGSDDMCEACAI
jgi:ribonucleoside-diphosphate reductase alpha chain